MLMNMFIAKATYIMTLKPTMWFLNVNRPRRNFSPSFWQEHSGSSSQGKLFGSRGVEGTTLQ